MYLVLMKIPDFSKLYASNDASLALYIFGAVYKLVLKSASSEHGSDYNMDSYLLLMHKSLPFVNKQVLKQANLLDQLEGTLNGLLKSKDRTVMMTRLVLSLLYQTFMV